MRKVKNQKAVTKIAMGSMKARKSKNVIAVLAIALTSVLFTALFTIGGAMIQKQQEANMRQVGGNAHAGYKYLTKEEYELLKGDPKIQDLSYRIILANAENKELRKLNTEISYYEDLDAKMCFCYPAEGTMPKEKYDLVASDLTLNALGVPCRIGQKVTLSFTVRGKAYTQEFTLCGWYRGDTVSMAQAACVSKEYVSEIAPTPTTSTKDAGMVSDDYAGRINADFNFKTSFNIQGQMDALTQWLGFEGISQGVNWAYLGVDLDLETAVFLIVMLAVILLSGYLIIYNIFYMNVYSDIRFYGLLKTVGTTGKQLKKIVHRQAYVLSLLGIPVGLLLGYFLGVDLFPLIMENLVFASTTTTEISANPLIFLGAALFSFLTVFISCIRPCRIASRVSPVEAVRFTEGKQKKISRTKKKKTKAITMSSFGYANIKRNKKKTLVVVLSLSISLILLNSVYSLIQGFSLDALLSNVAVSDYMVTDATTDNAAVMSPNRVTDGVTKEFLNELERQEGVEEIGNIWMERSVPDFTEEGYQLFSQRIWSRKEELFAGFLSMNPVNGKENLERIEKARDIDGKTYGLDRLPFEKMEVLEGELDWEKFSSGKYIITNWFGSVDGEGGADGSRVNFYNVGEKVTISNKEGETREYEVMAVAKLPYSAEFQSYGIIDLTYFLPKEEFFWCCGESQPMKCLFNVEEEKEEEIKAWIEGYCTAIDPDLDYTSKDTYKEEYDSYIKMFAIIGGGLSFILGFIGILNFINTIVTSILSRRQELAMIESVGMTGGQLRRMLMWEGGYYAFYTLILSLLFGALLNVTVIRNFGKSMPFFEWDFTLWPIFLCALPIFLVVLLVPVLVYRKLCRTSVVERIRISE